MPSTQPKKSDKKKQHTAAGGKSSAAQSHRGKGGKKAKQKDEKVKGGRRGRKHKYTAKTADRHELYQLAVQSPDSDVEFLRGAYEELRKKTPHHLREDFCGTALLAATWVRQGPEFTAEGYDLDPEPVEWGRERNLAPLGADAERVQVFVEDARAPGAKKPDVRVAQNFSYSLFKERADLVAYFRLARESLAKDGIFVIDHYGGTEANEHLEEDRVLDEGFTYVWDQHDYKPGTGDFTCYIHFHFKDGTRMRRAFEYVWRYYSMPELKDALREAGFREVRSYFEGSDDGDEGNGEFERDDFGENCAGWIAYLVAIP